ncbi:MAG: hypothetical protein ACKOB6_01050 [Candidatus Kapaibacterium sp.]
MALTLSMFFTFWSSTSPEFWIPQNLIFWLLVVLLFVDGSIRSHRVLAGYVVSSLLLVNLFGGIVQSKSRANDLHYQRLHGILGNGDADPVVISLNSGMMKDYLVRYKVKRFFCIEEAHRETYRDTTSLRMALDSVLMSSPHGLAYATAELLDPEPGKYPQDLLVFLRAYVTDPALVVERRNAGNDDAYVVVRKESIQGYARRSPPGIPVAGTR